MLDIAIKRLSRHLFVLAALQLAGCSSMVENLPPGIRLSSAYRDVKGALEHNDFRIARQRLEEAGVGGSTNPEKMRDRDAAAAREFFEDKVKQTYLNESAGLIQQGKPRAALNMALTGEGYCPWCTQLTQAVSTDRATVAEIDAFGRRLRSVLADKTTPTATLRDALAEGQRHGVLLGDSPEIRNDLRLVGNRVAKLWESQLQTLRPAQIDNDRFRKDLALLDVMPGDRTTLMKELELLAVGSDTLLTRKDNRAALITVFRTSHYGYPDAVMGVQRILGEKLLVDSEQALRVSVAQTNPDPEVLSFAEEFYSSLDNPPSGIRTILSQGHSGRAAQLAGTGRTSVLTLVHLNRAQELGLPVDAAGNRLRDTATASFATAGRLELTTRIETNPSDNPTVQDLARFAVLRAMRDRLRPHVSLQLVSTYSKNADIDVRIESVKAFVPQMSDLSSRSSTYLSHFEDAPNPAKAALKAQLAYQEITVNTALNNYNFAVSSFNINPTSWGLQNVNNARTQYNFAIDQYNQTVQIYNATSSTVSRPVYLPYSFREGTVRQGWQIAGVVKVGKVEERFYADEVDSDFVRIGTKPQDRNESYRRDDLLDIPVGLDRMAEQLVKASSQIQLKIAQAARGLRVSSRTPLSEGESAVFNGVLYPFSDDRPAIDGTPRWADGIVRTLALPGISVSEIPARRINAPGKTRAGTPQEMVAYYGPAIALIAGKGSTGSGALISSDGLVLTAAHVLSNGPFTVTFPRSGDNRQYATEIVFINDSHDVALLKITNYRSERWLEIGLNERAIAGEPVVALGNPGILGSGGLALTTISSGIVAKPYDPSRKDGLPDIVADIAVASGSSGGPLISRKTGRIVGVVTAVVPPSVKEDFANSGYWAVAAPSSELGRWLGLSY